MSNNVRIRTQPGGGDKHLNVKIDQKFDFIEILSLKISQDEAYQRFCSDYGVVVGRVIVNNGLGVPNAKVSIFIPIDEEDAMDPEIFGLYPYEVVTDKDSDGIPYNLMTGSARGKDECFTPIGTFPTKREVQDNPELTDIYCKYYKFTTTTNDSGDFMLFGVPVGTHYIHVDADISDIGILSQRPYDLISQGLDGKKFYSTSKFKDRVNDPNLTQLKTVSPVSVTVVPFWGDTEECEVGITRTDVDLKTTIIPTAIFMGSVITDNEKDSVNKNCDARTVLGRADELVTGKGTIEMIRYNNDGAIESFDVEGGRVIDEDGTWAYQIPMNIDYVVTSEEGDLVPSEDPTKGIATRSRVRFRLSVDDTGNDGRLRTRAKYLIPHNPEYWADSDYTFDSTTNDKSFTDLYWNKIYTVKNYLARIQPRNIFSNVESRSFVGIKDVDEGSKHSPFPFNKMDTDTNPLFIVLCIIISIIVTIICLINAIILPIINIIFYTINIALKIICVILDVIMKVVCGFISIIPFVGPSYCRCYRNTCIGCQNGCGSCNCGEVIGLVPYITLGCEGSKYAICGSGSGFPFRNTLQATVNRIALNSANDEASASNICNFRADIVRDDFHYAGDGHCHDDKIPLVDDAGFLTCILLQIAEILNVFKFDFYNDWVNGTLYSYLIKYKKKKNDDGVFCNNDKNFNFIRLVDSCTVAPPQNTGPDAADNFRNIGSGHGVDSSEAVSLNEGYIKQFDGHLYYAAYSRTSPYRLHATDIVSLGSTFDCDWQGVPKIYPWLVETTYNMPPLVGEYSIINGSSRLVVSGYDSSSCDDRSTPLIGHINCLGLQTGPKQCNNIKRLSELGMGLDERRLEDGGTNRDNAITKGDIENPFIRGAFIFANKKDEIGGSTIPLTYIDSETGGSYSYDYADPTYALFRDRDEKRIWEYQNSLYFYFGLNPGKTALNKMLTKFFPTCVPEKDTDFFVFAVDIVEDDLTPEPTGAITLEIVGGIGPYTFTWTGPRIEGNDYPLINDTQNIDNLFVGTYNVLVKDSIGNVTEGNFVVPGPPTVQCDIQTSPTVRYGSTDGSILVSVFSGTLPYGIELFEASTGNLIDSFPNISTASFDITGLGAGDYTVIVTDSGTPRTECSRDVTVTQPQPLSVEVIGNPVTCFGFNNGIAVVNINGGVPPYDIQWSNGKNTATISNLQPDEYTVTVVDGVNQSDSGSYSVVEPTKIEKDIDTKNITCLLSNDTELDVATGTEDGELTIQINGGGTPPYTIGVRGPDGFEFFTSGSTATLTDLPYGSYRVQIADSDTCVLEEVHDVFRPDKMLGGTLSVDRSQFIFTFLQVLGPDGSDDFRDTGGFGETRRFGKVVGVTTFVFQGSYNQNDWYTIATTRANKIPVDLDDFPYWRCILIDNNKIDSDGNPIGENCFFTTDILRA